MEKAEVLMAECQPESGLTATWPSLEHWVYYLKVQQSVHLDPPAHQDPKNILCRMDKE